MTIDQARKIFKVGVKFEIVGITLHSDYDDKIFIVQSYIDEGFVAYDKKDLGKYIPPPWGFGWEPIIYWWDKGYIKIINAKKGAKQLQEDSQLDNNERDSRKSSRRIPKSSSVPGEKPVPTTRRSSNKLPRKKSTKKSTDA